MSQGKAGEEAGLDGKQRAAQSRRAALVRATREQIMANGPGKVSLAEVLRQAGGSKATVAKYFGDREGLIAAAINETARDAMRELQLEMPHPGVTLEEGLVQTLAGLLRFYLLPETLVVYRGVIAAAGTQLASAFYSGGHLVVVAELAAFLRKWAGSDLPATLDWEGAAGQLTHMIRSGPFEQALLGLIEPAVGEEVILAQARLVARVFLQGTITRD
ncbi:transcriptional regulator, TetR family [Novosphingobium sp. CF614]|uniref:TetR/AcrR family transcriptional regulator n=1 Tax=Novosphingobium sp. CF614 TaxID=1884364 RepID=UPI0008EA32AB|nr:TetR/AcrR family transcriptional regulator C-terminal domain-containing protein [Novosphingobium sp. CF614]SFG42748.1 transcriptional regulator, TetR family [Novosphingobium sp. CF614]